MRACARQDLAPAKKQVQVSKGNVMPCVRPSYNLPHQAVQAVERDLPHFACILISWLPHCIRIAPHFFDERLARRSCAAGCIIPPPLLFKKNERLVCERVAATGRQRKTEDCALLGPTPSFQFVHLHTLDDHNNLGETRAIPR